MDYWIHQRSCLCNAAVPEIFCPAKTVLLHLRHVSLYFRLCEMQQLERLDFLSFWLAQDYCSCTKILTLTFCPLRSLQVVVLELSLFAILQV